MGRSLVTGGAGFIGSHLVAALLTRGEQVVVLDNLSTGKRANLAGLTGPFEFVEGDVADPAAAARACAGVDVVYHQAALASVPRSIEAPLDSHAACATGTLVMLDAARKAGARRFVYAASSSCYGDQPTSSKRESDLPSPLSPYAAAKLAGEMYCLAFHRSYGLETVALRYFNVFGPRQDPHGAYAAVIPRFIDAWLKGERLVLYGDGRQSRDFTYVENVVAGNLLAAESPRAAGRVLNLASGRSYSLLDLIASLEALLGRAADVRREPARIGDVRDSLADITLARELLGYEPVVDFHEGLRRTLAWYREQSAT
jgi:UDP-glucose 4-epimerase